MWVSIEYSNPNFIFYFLILIIHFFKAIRFIIFNVLKGKDKTTEERRIAICIFDNMAEQCRKADLKYITLHSTYHNYLFNVHIFFNIFLITNQIL